MLTFFGAIIGGLRWLVLLSPGVGETVNLHMLWISQGLTHFGYVLILCGVLRAGFESIRRQLNSTQGVPKDELHARHSPPEPIAPPTRKPPPLAAVAGGVSCPNCGEWAGKDDVLCPKCGLRLRREPGS